jgi:hypothetical protein
MCPPPRTDSTGWRRCGVWNILRSCVVCEEGSWWVFGRFVYKSAAGSGGLVEAGVVCCFVDWVSLLGEALSFKAGLTRGGCFPQMMYGCV